MATKIYNVPVFKPALPRKEEIIPFLEILDVNGVYSNFGPLVKELENNYAVTLGVSPLQVVALSNATLALQACIHVSKPNKWILPNYTFAASGHAVQNSNKLVYVNDVDFNDYQLSIKNLDFSSQDEFGLLPVMPFGAPINQSKWIRAKYVVIDAAASLGSLPLYLDWLPEDWFVVFSLHATKIFAAGEGALVVAGSAKSADKVRSWANFGFNNKRISTSIGTNAKMPEISAAYALASFKQRQHEIYEWQELQNHINQLTLNRKYATICNSYGGVNPYWIINCGTPQIRNKLINQLNEYGISSREWWTLPLSEMSGIKTFALDKTPNSFALSKSLLGLPKFRGLNKEYIDITVDIIDSIIN